MTVRCASSLLAGLWLATAGALAQETPEPVVEKTKRAIVHADTLWDLARYFYKDPRQWTRIYEANKDQIKDPHWIYPNQVFIIPGFDRPVQVVKTGQKEQAPEEAASAPAEPAPAPAPAEETAPVRPDSYHPNRASGAIPLPESLSIKMPKDMTSGQPSAYRLLMPAGWTPDGRIVAFKDRESFAAEGDMVQVRVEAELKVTKGLRFTVFRHSAATEADADPTGLFMEKVGVIQVLKRLAERDFRAAVLRSGGVVQTGDLVKAGE